MRRPELKKAASSARSRQAPLTATRSPKSKTAETSQHCPTVTGIGHGTRRSSKVQPQVPSIITRATTRAPFAGDRACFITTIQPSDLPQDRRSGRCATPPLSGQELQFMRNLGDLKQPTASSPDHPSATTKHMHCPAPQPWSRTHAVTFEIST